ncbi:MAG: HIT family protein [Parcubacteria group bacterium]
MENKNCLFCKIAAKEIPSEVVYEDKKTFAFLDIKPVTPGHVVIIPKFHAENIIALPDEEIAPLFGTVKKITALVKEKLKPKGFTIGINHGEVEGVKHIHVHVIPRYNGDGGRPIQSIAHFSSGEPLSVVREKLTL